MNIFIILFTILFAILSWKRLDWATALVLVLLPTYQIRFSLLGLPSTLLEVMVVILFLTWLVRSWQKKELPLLNFKLKNIKPYPFSYEIMAVLIIALIAVIVAGFSNASLGILKAYFIEPIMFFIVFVNVYHVKSRDSGERSEFNMVFWALAISAFLISVATIYQKITGQFIPAEYIGSGRMTGLFNYPNAVGLYLGPVIILLAGYLLSLKNFQFSIFKQFSIFNTVNEYGTSFQTLFFTLSIATSLIAVYLAKSEGALIGIVVALIIFGLLYNKLSRKVVVGLLVISAIVLSFNASLRTDIYKKISLQDKDGQIRIQLWQETWEMLKDDKFILGAGLANYQNAIVPYHQSGIYVRNDDPEFDKMIRISLEYQQRVWQPLEIYLYPHNIFLNFWVELGLAGMLLFSWIIIKFFVVGFKIQDSRFKILVLSLLCAMIVLVIHGLVDAPYFKNDLAIIFWLLIAIMGIVNLQLTTNKK